jgi:lysophospholipase L1-like esterase
MRNLLFLAAGFLLPCLYPTASIAQKKVIVVLGSSTAEGVGVTNPDSAYVRIVEHYYQNLGLIDTIYDLAVSGFTTYYAMPNSYVAPPDRPAHSWGFNVTSALALNPDVVLVNLPTNDIVDGYATSEYLSNLHTIYDSVIAAGKICYVTTTQPLDNEPVDTLEILRADRDSILNEFGAYSIDFYDPLVASDSLTINPLYYLDGTHVNAAGHRVLAQTVINANILDIMPLALSLTNFSAISEQQDALISWTDVLEDANTAFEIQRSADGSVFSAIGEEKGQATGGLGSGGAVGGSTTQGDGGMQTRSYSWTDKSPLNGRSFYRLKITEGANETYSKVASISRSALVLGIGSIYTANGSALFTADITIGNDQTVVISVFNSAGGIVWQQAAAIVAPLTKVSVDMTRFAKGVYFLQVMGPNGGRTVKSFPVF